MNRQVTLTTAVLFIFVAGCDGRNYEIVRAGDQTFLVEKSTGSTRLIEGTSFVEVKARPAVLPDDSAGRAKSWPAQDIPQLDNIKISTRTKYRDGKLLYSVEATPFKGRLEKEFAANRATYLGQPTVFLDFYDSDGFAVGEPLELRVPGATRIVNAKGEAHALSWTGTQTMTLDTYRAAQYQSVRWAGFAD
jgi:hypothetical protein